MVRANRAKTRIHPAALLVAVGALLARPGADADAAEQVARGGEKLQVIAGIPRNWPPQYGVDADGKPIGFAIDVMDAIAARAGVRVTYKVFKNLSGITARLQAGDIDLIPNAGIAPHRKKTMLFTPPVETFVISLFVRRDTSDIEGFSDIEGHTIAVIGTNLAGRILKKRAGLDLKVFTDLRVALFELVAGHVDALAYPRPVILKLAREAGILHRIRPVGAPLVEVKRGIAVRLGATALRDRLSRAVKAFVTTPEYRRIYVKWYGEAKPFWTAERMGWTMGGVMVVLLVIMAVWRHVSLLRVNRKLVANISQRIEARRDLEESEERYRSLAEFVPEAVLVTDYGRIRFCNPAAVRLFGAENAEQLIGLDQSKLVHAEDRPRLRARIDQGPALRPLSSMMELRRFRLDGSAFFSESRSAPFMWEGKAVRLVIIRDITERKRAEQQVGDLNRALEQRVEARTAELRSAQDELVKSERLATLGQLTATVSHELRNPLGAMRTSIYMLRNHMPSSDARLIRAAERIDRNITRCDGIIDELLDFTRIRELDIEPAVLDDWLGLVLDEQAVPDGVEVRRAPGASEIVVALDADRLRRAVVNVYDNACQAMTGQVARSDGDRESVLIVATRAIRDRVEISFRDTGPGIPADLREKIFEPLFSTKGFGVGLGLCVVRQILEQHGGGIEIASQDGGGAEFMLWLPQHHYRDAAE